MKENRDAPTGHLPGCAVGEMESTLAEMARDLAGMSRQQRRAVLREFERETGIRVKLTRMTRPTTAD